MALILGKHIRVHLMVVCSAQMSCHMLYVDKTGWWLNDHLCDQCDAQIAIKCQSWYLLQILLLPARLPKMFFYQLERQPIQANNFHDNS